MSPMRGESLRSLPGITSIHEPRRIASTSPALAIWGSCLASFTTSASSARSNTAPSRRRSRRPSGDGMSSSSLRRASSRVARIASLGTGPVSSGSADIGQPRDRRLATFAATSRGWPPLVATRSSRVQPSIVSLGGLGAAVTRVRTSASLK